MKKTFRLLSIVLFSMGLAQAGAVYFDDQNGDLFEGDPTTATYSYVGTSSRAAIFGGFTDIAFTPSGNLYGLDPSGLLSQISPTSGHIMNDGGTNNSIGSTGAGSLQGLGSNSAGILFAGGSNTLYTINPTVGPTATAVGTNTGTSYSVEGDLVFVGGNLYLTSTGDNGSDFFSVNPSTGAATLITSLAGVTQVTGLAYDSNNATLYGYEATGQQFQINPNTGAVSNIVKVTTSGGEDPISSTNEILGAAFDSATPEPGSGWLLCAAAIISLVFLAGRRSSQRAS